MIKYLRLLRLQDQYVEVVAAIGAGIFLQTRSADIFWWAIACVCLSVPAYMLNEFVDRKDSDRYSTNPIHIHPQDRFDTRIVACLFFGFSLAGGLLSWHVGLLGWGIALWSIGLLYSLEPVRLKRRFGIDLLAQVTAWWIIPLLAPIWGKAHTDLTIALVIITTLVIVPVLHAYQLADIVADTKAGHASTHVVLGSRKSLRFGFFLGIGAMLLYGMFDVFVWASWTLALLILLVVTEILYMRWMKMSSVAGQTKDIRCWIPRVKPWTQLFGVCLLYAWYRGIL